MTSEARFSLGCRFNRVADVLKMLTLTVVSCSVLAQGNERSFDIPEQPLSRALITFSKQAEMVFIAPTNLLDTIRSNAVIGEYSPNDALQQLLEGTGFVGTISLGLPPTLLISPSEVAEIEVVDHNAVDEVVVVGLRKSLNSALALKQNANNVIDAIIAEDIGKSTDQNIAEALQRVPGIAINRLDGEGSTISVRGAGPDLNIVTLNGITLTSSDINQSVDFSQFSADILHSIEVYKTQSADHDEGSLGAAVRLRTLKPLDAQRDQFAFELQSRINPHDENEGFDLSDADDYKISGSFLRRFLDDRLGVSLVAARETSSIRRDRYFATWFEPTTVNAAINANSIDLATFDPFNVDPNSVEILTGLDIDGDGVLDPLRGHQVRQSQYRYELIDRTRSTVTGSVQFQPTDDAEIYASATYSSQDNSSNQSFITNNSNVPRNDDPLSVIYDPETFTFLQNIYTSRIGTDDQTGVIRNFGDIVERTINNQIYSIGANRRVGSFTFSLNGGYSKTSSSDGDNLSIRSFVPRNGGANLGSGFFNGYSCTPNPEICRFILSPGLINNTDAFEIQDLQIRDESVNDTSASVFFDVDWEPDSGPFTVIEAGLKWASRKKDNFATSQNFRDAELDGAFSELSLSDFTLGQTPSDWGAEFGLPRDELTNGWPLFDAAALRDVLIERNGGLPALSPNLRNTRTIEQDIFAGYIKANFAFFDETLVGDVGLRIARTNVDAEGFSGFSFRTNLDYLTPENISFFGSEEATIAALGPFLNDDQSVPAATQTIGRHDYTNVLPSLNIVWTPRADIALRFAASQTIARPRIDSLNPAFNINELPLAPESTAFFGATTLDPFESTNIDLSAAWYFAEDSIVSLAFFNKSLSNFEETGQFRAFWQDFRSALFDQNGNALAEPSLIATPENALLPLNGGPNQPGCLPNRELNLLAPEGAQGCDVVVVNQNRNGQGGFVRGLEVSLQHNFTWAPSFLRNVGIAANYTFASSETDEQTIIDPDGSVVAFFPALPLVGTSKHTFNTTLFYESEKFLLRLAYNNRSDYLINRAERDGTANWIEGADSLDLSAEYRITPNVSLNLQAVNLTDSVRRVYSTNVTDVLLPTDPNALDGNAPTSRTVELSNTGPIYRASLRFNF